MQSQHRSWQVPCLAVPLPSTPAFLLLDSCSRCSLLYFGTPAHRQLPATVANTTFICCQRKLSAHSSDQPSGLQLPSSRRSFQVALSFEVGALVRSAASLWIRGTSSNKRDSLCSCSWWSQISKSPISVQAGGRRVSYLPVLHLDPLACLHAVNHSKDNAQNEDEHIFSPQVESKLGIGSGNPPS